MTQPARIAVILVALAAHAISLGAGQGVVIRIVALDSTVKLPPGWKLIEDAGPRGCAFETPEGVRVDVVVWTPDPPAQGSWDERHAAWEHGILLKRSCDFTSRRERQVPGPLAGRGLLVSGRARAGEQEWAGAYLAFKLDARRACVIGSFAAATAGDEVPVSAIFEFVKALRAAHQQTAPVLVAGPEAPSSGETAATTLGPDVGAGEQTQPTSPTIAGPQGEAERPASVPGGTHSLAPRTAEDATSSSPSGLQPRGTPAPVLSPGEGLRLGAVSRGELLTDLPTRPARVQLSQSPPSVPTAASWQAEDIQMTPPGLGAARAGLPERASTTTRGGAAAADRPFAFADRRPLVAALGNVSATPPGVREPVFGDFRPGIALPEGWYSGRPVLASALPAVAPRATGEPSSGLATAPPLSAPWLASQPAATGMAVVEESRPSPPMRLATASLGPGREDGSPAWSTGALSPVARGRAGRPAPPMMAATNPVVGPRAWAAPAVVARHPSELSQPLVVSTATSYTAILAAGEKPRAIARTTSATADIRPRRSEPFRVSAAPLQVARVAPGAAVPAPASARVQPGLVPAQSQQVGSTTKPLGQPLAATPDSSGPTAGWVTDETGLLRVRVPLGWKVSVKVTGGPGLPAVAVYGSHAQEPNLRFAWVQPSMPRYRDLSQLLVALGYREWERYRDTASGEQLVVAKRRGARRFLEDVVLPDSYGGLHTWQILDAQPSSTAAGMVGSGEGLVAHVMAAGDRGTVEGWYSVATGTPPGQSAQTWVGAWLVALGPPGDRRPLEALVQAVAGAEATGPQAGQEIRGMVLAAQAAIKDLTRSTHTGP
ncbi:MAG: hypothetical protein N2512_14925 [Armatimonadetes bacterium]|nr:hypothetical protein [Armatimonadota bacterium]